ncbi:MAG: YggS family pyridoxal phosphate-dependent enzyme [Dehalococcoidia bacterium]
MTVAASEFATRLSEVREHIARAAERSGRSPEAITLIAVSKTHPAGAVIAALRTGQSDFGENRVQEGVAKAAEVASLAGALPGSPKWHLIGHLQTNKVRAALGTFAILHSVDSERLLRAISAAATSPAQVFIEVNVAAEPQKYGIAVAEVPAMVEAARSLPNIVVTGLMTVAPHVQDVEQTRPIFRTLRGLAEANALESLSMGMTNDYEVAIEEGSTHVRIGRALFGDRQ